MVQSQVPCFLSGQLPAAADLSKGKGQLLQQVQEFLTEWNQVSEAGKFV